jgi:uncharacterized coiled-coil protein SlyX
MRNWHKPRKAWLGTLLVAITGCTISIQPWSKPPPPPDPNGANLAGHKGGAPNPFPLNPMAQNGSGNPLQPAGGNEAIAVLQKELNDMRDHRDALMVKLKSVQSELKVREGYLLASHQEIDDSTKMMKKTREELKQWQGEMDELRDRLKRLEDSRSNLKPLIEEILYYIEREKDAPKTLRLPTPRRSVPGPLLENVP